MKDKGTTGKRRKAKAAKAKRPRTTRKDAPRTNEKVPQVVIDVLTREDKAREVRK